MRKNKNNKQDPSIIGGTIAVPYNTIDDVSCRSDLTLDLDLHESPRPRRKKLDIMLPPLPSRDADESTHYSPPHNGTTRRDYYDDDDGMSNNDKDIDKIAEQAAYSCFGADADQKLDEDGEGRPIRRSTLVAENSAIDASWFAARGLMSRRSFERYQKEMGINSSSSNNLKRRKGKGTGMKRASISMCDLRNQEWNKDDMMLSPSMKKKKDKSKKKTKASPEPLEGRVAKDKKKSPKAALDVPFVYNEGKTSATLSRHGKRPPKSVSLEEGLYTLGNSVPQREESGSAGDEGLDELIASFRTTFENGGVAKKSDQVDMLAKMMRRLSQEDEQDDSPFTDDDIKDSLNQDDVLNDMTRYCSSDDLLKDDDMAFNPREDTREYLKKKSDLRPNLRQMPSIKSMETLKMSHTGSHGKYVPSRTSSIELKGKNLHPEPELPQEVNYKREDTMSTLSHGESIVLDSNSIEPKMKNFPSPLQNSYKRRDTISTMSPPNSPRKYHVQEEEQDGDDTINSISAEDLDRPQLDRGASDLLDISNHAVASFSYPSRGGSLSTTNTNQARTEWGNATPGTDCAVTLEIPSKTGSHTTSRNKSPIRCYSNSSTGTGEGLSMRRNSFSSLFTTPTDLDSLEGPPLKDNCGDILQEGMDYLSQALLAGVYGRLRELSLLGLVHVKLVDIDVNSHQALARKKEMKRRGLNVPKDDSYLKNTKTAGAVVRSVLDEYNMFKDEMTFKSTRAVLEYDASLLRDFSTWVEESKVKQLDDVTEAVIKQLRQECFNRQAARLSNNSSPSTMEQADVRSSITRRRLSLIEKSESFQDSTWMKQERTLIADYFGVNKKNPRASICNSGDVITNSFIDKTIEKSNDYFQEGSSLRNLLDSGLEVVWFSDRHPDDIIYCICVNRATVTVTVIFRAEEGFFDLLRHAGMSSYSNPIVHEDYDGNSDTINLRSKVSDELLRVRRDTKKSTLDEIKAKVIKIGNELTEGGKFHLSITGHSLAGGLATVAGFFLASDPTLELASAVRVFTFASSRVGCKAFSQGFKHLEETGRLMMARFTNSNEIRSMLPMKDTYHHVGMQICLHKANNAGRQRARKSLDVSYNSNDSRLGDIFHFLRNFVSAFKSSRISEYQYRMHRTREYRLALGDGVLRFDKKRNRLKSLNDYYLMKCRLPDFMSMKEKSSPMPSFFVFFLVSCLISFEIALLIKFVAPW